MQISITHITTFLNTLEETPSRIASASAGLESARLHFRPDKKTWSANDNLAHLRACADVWGNSMLEMIAQDHPTLPYLSPPMWLRKAGYLKLDFHESLSVFTRQRAVFMSQLKLLTIQDWSRGATLVLPTRSWQETVFRYARRMALHERTHCGQIEALLRK
jgi:hypothetical protein